MYTGGMAGTGKSQVVKALTAFFERRNESHHIVITAPTSTAAALVGRSTYHSILGINDKSASTTSMAKVRTRLDGVNYLFLNEVSMLSCHDMYNISAQPAKAFNEPNKPFGGLNMVFLVISPNYLLLVVESPFPSIVVVLALRFIQD